MTQEEKDLLMKELCTRLPYGVIVHGVFLNYNKEVDRIQYEECDRKLEFEYFSRFETLKPYLRPMSSMTKEERDELRKMTIIRPDYTFGMSLFREEYTDNGYVDNWSCCSFEIIDWLNAHHFDYRGLIEKGLAIEAPEDMYKKD